jgi:hypothetical protein
LLPPSPPLTFNNFLFFLFFYFSAIGDDLLEFHQAVVSTLRDADEIPIPLDPAPPMMNIPHHSMMPPVMNDELGRISDVINTDQPLDPEDELDPGEIISPDLLNFLISCYVI